MSALGQMVSPPYSANAEQAVIGYLLCDNQAISRVQGVLSPEDFFFERHALIYRVCLELAEKGAMIDPISVSEYLEREGSFYEIGGLTYIGDLAQAACSGANLEHYANIVRENSVLRSLLDASRKIAEDVHSRSTRTAAEVVEIAERRILMLSERSAKGRSGFESIQDLSNAAIDRIDRVYARQDPIDGLRTGYLDLDRQLGGLQKADLVIVAARPSMGKTAFAMGIAANASTAEKAPVAVFSMEMPGEQLAMRLFASIGRLDYSALRVGQLSDEDWPQLTAAIDGLTESRMYIDSTPGLTPTDLRARARRLAREQGGLGLVVVDYLQLMRVPEIRNNRVQEVSEISRSLKALAKELDCPVVALSQLNRGLEQRPNKRPTLSDLRDSGAIEQDADVVLFLYRDEVYDPQSGDRGVAEVIIGKQRNGPIGKVRLAFVGPQMRFADLAPDREYR